MKRTITNQTILEILGELFSKLGSHFMNFVLLFLNFNIVYNFTDLLLFSSP